MSEQLTTDPIEAPPVPDHIRPEFIRLPKQGHLCPYSGLSRAGMNGLVLGKNPPVKSFVLRKRGARSGTRLIVYDSLIHYLKSKMGEERQRQP